MTRRSTTFSQLMTASIGIILLSTSLLMAVFYITMRGVQIDNRINALKTHAGDIAFLFGSSQSASLNNYLPRSSDASRELLSSKLRSVYEEYEAYCLMVDQTGRGVAYFLSILDSNQDLQANFDPASITSTLSAVLSGQEVVTQNDSPSGPMFTVAVPWVQGNRVQGAVYIQTAAQTVHGSYEGLILRVAGVSLIAMLGAVLIALFYARRVSAPLRDMAEASRALSVGDFTQHVTPRGTREMQELAGTFNLMSSQLKSIETTRRDFVANISHELRSPMTSIQGFIQGMLDGTIPPDNASHYLQLSLDESIRMNKLINSLLRLSHIEDESFKLNPTVFDIQELSRRVLINAMERIEAKRIKPTLDFHSENQFVRADRDQIEQVLINLVDNAVKFTPEGGNIWIRTRMLNAQVVEVVVKDNGIGVLPQDAPHIFDRFFKADKSHSPDKGTGLGLSITRMILEKHGQSIKLLNEGKGAAFAFTLEAAKDRRQRNIEA